MMSAMSEQSYIMRPAMSEHLPQQYLPNFLIAPPGNLQIYMVHESELVALEDGSPDSKFLTLGVALVSAGGTFGATLLATPSAVVWVKALFSACALVGLVNGSLLLYLWRRSHLKIASLARKIRQRLPSDDRFKADGEKTAFAPEAPGIDEMQKTARSL